MCVCVCMCVCACVCMYVGMYVIHILMVENSVYFCKNLRQNQHISHLSPPFRMISGLLWKSEIISTKVNKTKMSQHPNTHG